MKYSTRVEIDLPRARVVELFADFDNYGAWQESLIGLEHLKGEPGQVGSTTRLVHKMGNREVPMLETVMERDLPRLFTATYEGDGVWNEAINRFTELEGGRTQWEIETEFRCTGMMWWMTTLLPWMFKKQTRTVMESFKAFAEAAGL